MIDQKFHFFFYQSMKINLDISTDRLLALAFDRSENNEQRTRVTKNNGRAIFDTHQN